VLDAARRVWQYGDARSAREKPEWEYRSDTWPAADGSAGWEAPSVVTAQREKWPAFVALLRGPGRLGIYHEAARLSDDNLVGHNLVMTYAYVLGRAGRGRDKLRMLDWGSGLGHYAKIAQAVMPEIALEYHGRDVRGLCAAARELLPDATFHDTDEGALARAYDLVLASGSLQYAPDWRRTMQRLAAVSQPFLFVTRLPVVRHAPSFVTVQRPLAHGYQTEYVNWFINRTALLQHAEGLGLALQREVLVGERPFVVGAPEQGELAGFLFERRA
jgi:putative methyltransferase (TIGR04325 family)